MKKTASFIVNRRIYLFIFICLVVIVSIYLIPKVKVNYDNASYLPNSSKTHQGLEIIKDEFEVNGSFEIMLENITIEETTSLVNELSNIKNIKSASFNDKIDFHVSQNNKGKALISITLNIADSDKQTSKVIDSVKKIIANYNYNIAGPAYTQKCLEEAMSDEMPIILIISITIVLAILLLTASSWLEPIIFLIVIGISIIINMGTNVFFDEISYITKAIAAILQLALSMDYSIMLLHRYNRERETIKNNKDAMINALTKTVLPISASGLTTIAGLLSLVFMTLKIGFDFGIVLSKGIIISMLCVFIVLPGLLLECTNILEKTKKKPFNLTGKKIVSLSLKNKVLIPTIALLIIITAFIVQTNNKYSFTDDTFSPGASEVREEFGFKNQMLLVFDNNVPIDKQKELIKEIEQYKSKDSSILNSYTSYFNTALLQLTPKDVSELMNISESNSEDLFSLYYKYNNTWTDNKISIIDLINFIYDINIEDLSSYVSIETINKLRLLKPLCDFLLNNNNRIDTITLLNKKEIQDLYKIDSQIVNQIYGMYYFDNDLLTNKELTLTQFCDIVKLGSLSSDLIKNMIGNDASKINTFYNEIAKITILGKKIINSDEFIQLLSNMDIVINQAKATEIINLFNNDSDDDQTFMNLLNYCRTNNLINEVNRINDIIERYSKCIDYYSYEEIESIIEDLNNELTGNTIDLSLNQELYRQLFIAYMSTYSKLPNISIKGYDLLLYLEEELKTNSFINNMINMDTSVIFDDVNTLYSVLNNNKLTSSEMYQCLEDLISNINSIELNKFSFTTDLIDGVYIKYAGKYFIRKDSSITALDLITFINNNMNSDTFLKKSINEDLKTQITSLYSTLSNIDDTFIGEDHTRIVLSINLDNKSDESEDFYYWIQDKTVTYLGEDSYICGAIMTTFDIRTAFNNDIFKINIITIILIFLIVALIFMSFSIPFMLILIIQGAIWISMSISVITSTPIFFISYIVAMCIQMGATIDYGILISSNYCENRRSMSKELSIKKAIQTSIPSICTSGLILITAGFVVGLISSQTAISSIGLLLGRGTIISLIMVLFVLPAMLLITDKINQKLTFNTNFID